MTRKPLYLLPLVLLAALLGAAPAAHVRRGRRFQRGARRMAPSSRITSPLSMSFSMMCLASLA